MSDYVPPRFSANPLPLPPYNRFRPAGHVHNAFFVDKSPLRSIKNPGTNTAAQKAGKRFEKKLLAKLETKPGFQVLKAPWIQYENGTTRWCQPDALIIRKDDILIIEAKLTHTANAYWQLRLLYEPVVRMLSPGARIHLVEITRSFDPNIRMPEEMLLFFDFEDLLTALPSEAKKEVYVLQWKL